jgi:RND family efflux transporter MFP subunit
MSLPTRAAASLLFVLPLLVACSRGEATVAEAAPTERAVQVRTVTVESRLVVERTSLPGDLLPVRRASLAAEVGGTVESVRVELGQAVAKRELLASVDERALAQQLAEAEAWLRQAEQQHRRAESLFERRAVTQAQLIDATTAREVAEARLASARLQLDKARVRAPWAGRIAARHIEIGDYVTPGAPLFELVDSSRLKVRASARSADVPYLAAGREVEVRIDAFPGEVFAARIERLGAELDAASRTLDVEAEIANPGDRLRPGLLARLLIPRRELPDALVVPSTALVELGESRAVYVVEEGRAVRRVVTLGPAIGEEVVVVGLAPGDRVIVEGQQAVNDGQKVEEL